MKKAKKFLLYVFTLFILTISVQAQSAADSTITKKSEKKYQAKAPKTQPFGAKAFRRSNKTTLRWLGMAGYFINSRGTTMMVDPLLKGFDMPVMIDFPIAPKDIPRLDAVLERMLTMIITVFQPTVTFCPRCTKYPIASSIVAYGTPVSIYPSGLKPRFIRSAVAR